LKFSADARKGWSLEQRRSEIAAWAARLSDPAARDLMAQSALCRLSQSALTLTRRIAALEAAVHASSARTAAIEARLRQANAALTASERRSGKLSRKLDKMRRSWPWRLTRPFRKLARRMARREQS
jgi:hypothetical protein